MTENEIVKVQMPLESNDPQPKALIYNKDRSIFITVIPTQRIIEQMKGEPKKYFHIHIVHNTAFELAEEVPAQSW